MNILIVDDCDSIRVMLTYALESFNFEVTQAAHGAAALECLHQRRPDLIMTDINMPVMDGITFIEQARQTEHGRDVPIFVLSSDARPDLMERGRDQGVRAWMVKPMDPMTIVANLLANAA